MSASPSPRPDGEIVLYQSPDGRTRVECRFVDETIWLSQALIAELYAVSIPTVNGHLRNIFDSGELTSGATIRSFRIVRREVRREVERDIEHYNLDVILAVGYRVRSPQGTHFRQWATERLKEYLLKGFVIDDVRLKNPPIPGSGLPDYFDELLERIRDIRASEKRLYLRVREIFALAGDYDPKHERTKRFFQTIQNKLHFAATGMTAPEIIRRRADHRQPNMGLTSWKGDVVRRADIDVAKNYLNEDEIQELNRIVVMWLDFAEDQARRRKQVFMQDWERKLDEFLRFNERMVLAGLGQVSREDAEMHAAIEFGQFESVRRRLAEAEGARDLDSLLEHEARKLDRPPEDDDSSPTPSAQT